MFIHLQQYTIKIAKIFCFVYILLNFFPSCATLPLRSRISASMWCVCVRWVFFLCAPRIASIDSQLCKLLLWTESKSFRLDGNTESTKKKTTQRAVDCIDVVVVVVGLFFVCSQVVAVIVVSVRWFLCYSRFRHYKFYLIVKYGASYRMLRIKSRVERAATKITLKHFIVNLPHSHVYVCLCVWESFEHCF